MGLGSTAGRGAAGTGASERRALSPAAESCSGSPSGSVTWDRDWRAAEQRAFLRPGGGPGLTRRRLGSRAGVVWAGLHLQTGTRRPCLSGQTTPRANSSACLLPRTIGDRPGGRGPGDMARGRVCPAPSPPSPSTAPLIPIGPGSRAFPTPGERGGAPGSPVCRFCPAVVTESQIRPDRWGKHSEVAFGPRGSHTHSRELPPACCPHIGSEEVTSPHGRRPRLVGSLSQTRC